MGQRYWVVTGCVLGLALLAAPAIAQPKKKPPKITYDDDVVPILRQKCFSCHNADKKSGDLDMTNYTNLMLGGGSGTVIEPGDSGSSYLYGLVSHEEEPYMPPDSPKLPDEMVETIRKWIDGGVLENKGSKALASKKKKFNLALNTAPTERPEVSPMPARLSLEPLSRTPANTAVSALATSPWSPLAAVAGQKQIFLYNTKELRLLGVLPFPEGIPHVLKFSRNGRLLLAGGGRGGASGKVVVWDITTGERVIEVGDELDAVLAADISSDQTLIALGGPQRIVRIYSTESGRLLHELRKHTNWIYSLEFSPDSVLLASGDRNGGLFVWEGWTGREYLTLKGHGGGVTGVSWRSDSNVLASCSNDSTVRLWEMENGGQIKSWGAHGGGAASVEFLRDGRLVSCGRDRVTKLWDQNGGQQRAFEAFGDLALEVTYCDETNRCIAGDWTGSIRVWNAEDGKQLGELSSNPPKLVERLAASEVQVAARQKEQKPLAVAYQGATAAVEKAQADLVAANKTKGEQEKQRTVAQELVKTSEAAVAKLKAEYEPLMKLAARLTKGVPVLNEAAQKSQQAAKELAGDKELTDAVAKLVAIAQARATQLKDTQKQVAEKEAALKKATTQLAEAQKRVEVLTKQLAETVKKIETLTAAIKPLQEKAAASKKALDEADAALKNAVALVEGWRVEIAFADKLSKLLQHRSQAVSELGDRETERDDAQSEVNEAQAKAATAKTNVTAAQLEVDKVNAEIQAARGLTQE
ncbi:MAG: hypothetical protein CMJ59_01235 [Planctomycetaceae bacterium]|nr:hypothetical protein [Planctomycetaceae bacterium]